MERRASGLLCDESILAAVNQPGSGVLIRPFNPDQLNTTSYDVRLGRFYYNPRGKPEFFSRVNSPGLLLYNPYSEEEVRRTCGPVCEAKSARHVARSCKVDGFEGVRPDELVIILGPGEFILAHTQEFIGGYGDVSTSMQARSSTGRSGLTVCACAGWGDIGYTSRWTMEIKNLSTHHAVLLVVGRRYAQIVFERVERSAEAVSYATRGGKYGRSVADPVNCTLSDLEDAWSPEDMLPKMYLDKETLAAVEKEEGLPE